MEYSVRWLRNNSQLLKSPTHILHVYLAQSKTAGIQKTLKQGHYTPLETLLSLLVLLLQKETH